MSAHWLYLLTLYVQQCAIYSSFLQFSLIKNDLFKNTGIIGNIWSTQIIKNSRFPPTQTVIVYITIPTPTPPLSPAFSSPLVMHHIHPAAEWFSFHLIWTLEAKLNLGRDSFLSPRKTHMSLAAQASKRLQSFLSMPNLYCRSQLGLSAECVMAHIWYSSHQHLIFWSPIHCFPVWYGRDSSCSWQLLESGVWSPWSDSSMQK